MMYCFNRWYNTLPVMVPTVFGSIHYLTHHKVNMAKRNPPPETNYSKIFIVVFT